MGAQEVNGSELSEYQPDQFGGATDKGPRRSENQDAFWIPDQNVPVDLGRVYLVADGVGGQQDGGVASKMAVEIVQRLFFDLRRQGEPIPTALKNALEQANLTILNEAQEREIRKMGATFVAAVLDAGKLIVAHVGDARAYLIRRGEIKRLTRDDSWVQKQVDAGLITEEEAANHEFRNVVTQVLGNKPEITVNISQALELQPGDVILLCSDGLYDPLSDSRMAQLASENEPQKAAELLVQAAVDAEATDNITAVVIRSGQFVSMAGEPTLVSPPTAVEAAPTIIVSPVSPSPALPPAAPPPAQSKGGISKWLIILAVVAILLIAGALLAFWLQSASVAGDSQDAAATAIPALIESPSPEGRGALRPLNPTATFAAIAVTVEPEATSTIPLPATPTTRPTVTVLVSSEPRGCVNGEIVPFVRTDEQFSAGCASTIMLLETGDEVRILNDLPVAPGGNCGPGQFIRIQSINDPALEGWIHQDALDLIAAGETCVP